MAAGLASGHKIISRMSVISLPILTDTGSRGPGF